ncbi:MAG: polysaccharide biosynthesis protein [Methylobacteriaceae bacterium]|nr:polysaccharide biosynthesis protein [Methylobacteriaceae bacterium]
MSPARCNGEGKGGRTFNPAVSTLPRLSPLAWSVMLGLSVRMSSVKRATIIVHDLVATAIALFLTPFLRFSPPELAPRWDVLVELAPAFLLLAAVVFRLCRLYASKWRFASLPDLFNIFRAASVLALALLTVDTALVARGLSPIFVFGAKAIFIYWVLQMFLLGGPRLVYRYMRYLRSRRSGERDAVPSVLVLGRSTEADVVLRALETGLRHRFIARGILSPHRGDEGISIRGVRVLGGYGELERVIADFAETDQVISRVIFAPNQFARDPDSEKVVATARRLGVALFRMQTVEDDGKNGAAALTPVDVEDILFRPPVETDHSDLPGFLRGKRVLVTGGGGSIGAELCLRLANFGAGDLVILDASEPALYAISEEFAARRLATKIKVVVADVRDRPRLFQLFETLRPNLVFHAAALKHVPQLEQDWTEGVKTNVFGSVNVADAAASVGSAVVLISTDKAVNPVSVLGATKRLSEMYVQMRDAEASAGGSGPRLISVRFGNVLVSSGSVVPKFKAQIARGGPVTVTHPDMVRYFMTVREATDLVLTASAHAVSDSARDLERASVYVLRMGQPARILDLAERLIRLAGLEPGRDVEIVFTGLRKGERMTETVFAADEPLVDVGVNGVMASQTPPVERGRLTRWLAELASAVAAGDRMAADRVFGEAFASYRARAVDGELHEPVSAPDYDGHKVVAVR